MLRGMNKNSNLARVTLRRVITGIHQKSVANYRVEEIIGRSDLPTVNCKSALVGDFVTQEDADNLIDNWADTISTRCLAPKE